MNILILCTGNSARSILLEAIFDELSQGRVVSFSAGSHPTGAVNPFAISLLKSKGIPTGHYASKSWNVFGTPQSEKMDIVITVCGNARDEECPFWPGAPIRAHWGVEDPAAITVSDEAATKAFQKAYDILACRAEAFMQLNFEAMNNEELQSELARIAKLHPSEKNAA